MISLGVRCHYMSACARVGIQATGLRPILIILVWSNVGDGDGDGDGDHDGDSCGRSDLDSKRTGHNEMSWSAHCERPRGWLLQLSRCFNVKLLVS